MTSTVMDFTVTVGAERIRLKMLWLGLCARRRFPDPQLDDLFLSATGTQATNVAVQSASKNVSF